ncbi:MAG: hemerythrin domain-containing protein, partial [Nocardioides sp.]
MTGHHTLEDASLNPHLRRSEPALGPVMDRLHEEHEVIRDVLEQFDPTQPTDRSAPGRTSPASRGDTPGRLAGEPPVSPAGRETESPPHAPRVRGVTAPRLAPDYPILTERLLLRPIDAGADLLPMHGYRSNPEVCR